MMSVIIDDTLAVHAISTFVCIFITILLRYRLQKRNGSKSAPPFAPEGLIETTLSLSRKDAPEFMVRNAIKLGDFYQIRLPIPGPMNVVVSNLDLYRRILNDRTSIKPDLYKTFQIRENCDDIFTSEGAHWAHSRKAISSAFSSVHIKRMSSILSQVTDEWISDFLTPLTESGDDFDVNNAMLHLTLSIINKVAFEYEISKSEREEFLVEIEIVLREYNNWKIPLRKRLGFFIPAVPRARLGAKRLLGLGLRVLESYRKLQHPTKNTVIDCIANNSAYLNDEERVGDIVVLMVAGHETTANTLAWILIELTRNPSIQRSLQETLIKTPFEDRGNLKELHNVIKEGMRLHPAASLGALRKISSDLTIKNGESEMFIPKGSNIFLPFIALTRNPRYYDNPTKFLPDRWNNISKQSDSAFLPFALGRHNCVGQSLAKANVYNVIPKLCSSFNFTMSEEGSFDHFITLKPVGTRLLATKV